MRKVCVVITARPSYSRVQTVLEAVEAHPDLQLQVVASASLLLERYGRAVDHIERDGYKIDHKLYCVVEGENLVTSAKTTGLALMELATVLDNLRPDVVITIADRYETIATSIAAAYLNIPLAHLQGGEITGSIDERVRHANTKLADLHFVSTEGARERVIKMGENPARVYRTGCPAIDLAARAAAELRGLPDPFECFGGVGSRFSLEDGYIMVMQHPVTNEYASARAQVEETLAAVDTLGLPALWFWPNVDAGSDGTSSGIRAYREQHKLDHVHFFKDVPPLDFLNLLIHTRMIVGNSSVAVRECSFLGVPAVNIGTREEGREHGPNLLQCGHDRWQILDAIQRHLSNGRAAPSNLYGDGHAGERIAGILADCDLSINKRICY